MASKEFVLPEGIAITVYKRRQNRSMRLSIAHDGTVRVTIPAWTPYAAALAFAQSRAAWIQAQQPPKQPLLHGQAIGKAHRLELIASPAATKATTRLRSTIASVTYPAQLPPTSITVQQAAAAVSVRALRKQAEALLPQRLQSLATVHGFRYRSVSVKQLKSRWGSCDSQGNIVLNLYLMQLPWECIDYVLLHELTHTVVLHHGPKFWAAMEAVLPNVGALRKQIRTFHPVLQ